MATEKMKSFDDIASSLQNFARRLSHEGWRTATVARLKLDLKSIDFQRKEAFRRLGEKVYEMKLRKSIRDDFLLENLVEHFEELEKLEGKSMQVLQDIQKITLMQQESRTDEEKKNPQEPIKQESCKDENPGDSMYSSDRLKNFNGIDE